jgi:hypothetical protein
MKKYKDKIVAKDVEIKFGEHDIKVDLYVNTEGNISIQFKDNEQEQFAPDGTCIEGFNTDVIFYPYFGVNLESKQKAVDRYRATKVYDQLVRNYSESDVVSGEFYMYEKISTEFTEASAREGIQAFLDWDESEAKFDLKKGKKYWIIIDK